jgi:hypothetical protein
MHCLWHVWTLVWWFLRLHALIAVRASRMEVDSEAWFTSSRRSDDDDAYVLHWVVCFLSAVFFASLLCASSVGCVVSVFTQFFDN